MYGSFKFIPLVTFSDPNVEQLQLVAADLQESLNNLWDDLPLDTVTASILDPRTKWFHRIPNHEINEALAALKQVWTIHCQYYIFYLILNYQGIPC
jgi:hypothetical protein